MSGRIKSVFVVKKEGDKKCEFCGEKRECRPYGPSGGEICPQCAESTPEMRAAVAKNFRRTLDGKKAK